ncbi:MAG: hypothetical protein EA364_06840 [Balneolaceae bacterium]|jgi:uncharacterized membrane protein HdeD (DUF308 family)|nr:MAG: hypothetical protein EA364_06840 [Balneolaceae bacterium]
MSKQIIYYVLLATGVIVIFTGLFIFFANYGDTTVSGIASQVVGIILLFSGIVNIFVGVSVSRQGIRRSEGDTHHQGSTHF